MFVLSVRINLKESAETIQQKGPQIQIHLQEQKVQVLKRLIESGYLARATKITEDCL